MAIAPNDQWDEFQSDLELMRENWFWHLPEGSEVDTETVDGE
jgi:hypothetical protein